MTISFFLTFDGPEDQRSAMGDWFDANLLPPLQAQAGVEAIEIYTAEKGHDPYLDDGAGPLLLAELHMTDIAALETAMGSADVKTALGDPAALAVPGCSVRHDAFEVVREPIHGDDAPQPRTAPLSYVVRYYRPAEDEKAFTDFYVAHHPPLLAQFPKIRNVLCYLPVDWSNPTDIPNSDCMLGNEVVFDKIEDFNAAMMSDVRHRLREDYNQFPPFSGPVTHFGMLRRKV